MPQSHPRSSGLDGHNASMAGADVAHAHGAAVTCLGTIGTRQGDSAQRRRTMPSQATPLSFAYEAGPRGSWRDRALPPKGADGWVVAPSWLPTTPGDRLTTARRDAVPWARLARAGALTVV
jgi:transposase